MRIFALHLLRATANLATGTTKSPVTIYGAGAAGIQLAASLKQSRELAPVMFIDDNPSLHNVFVYGIRVKPQSVLKKSVGTGRIEQVLIAIPSLSPRRRASLVRDIGGLGYEVRVIPSYVDLVSGKEKVDVLRAVKLDKLLGRDKVGLNAPQIENA